MNQIPEYLQSIIVFVLVPVLVWALRLAMSKWGILLNREVVNIVLLCMSAAICLIVKPPIFPEYVTGAELGTYTESLAIALGAYTAGIKLVYDFILARMFKSQLFKELGMSF